MKRVLMDNSFPYCPCVSCPEKVDLKRVRHFAKCFTEKIREFAITERAKYPSKEELVKKYKNFKEEDFPIIECPCMFCEQPNIMKYHILPVEEDPRWGLGKNKTDLPFFMEVSGTYLQHLMQVEDVEGLLRISIVDPRFHFAFYHEHGSYDSCASGYGECVIEMYFRLYIFLNFAIANQEKYLLKPNIYNLMGKRHYRTMNFGRVAPHKIFKLLEANPTLEDEAVNKELLRLTFKQLYLLEMLHMDTDRPIFWESAIDEFILSISTKAMVRPYKDGIFCETCHEMQLIPHIESCPGHWHGKYRK